MQTKSNIQIIAEVLQAKAEFFGTLRNVLEKYDIEDNVFCCGGNGRLEEPKEGYFGQVKHCANLEEAAEDFNILNQGIRIKNNEIFVGNLYRSLDQVTESTFIDLDKQVVINS